MYEMCVQVLSIHTVHITHSCTYMYMYHRSQRDTCTGTCTCMYSCKVVTRVIDRDRVYRSTRVQTEKIIHVKEVEFLCPAVVCTFVCNVVTLHRYYLLGAILLNYPCRYTVHYTVSSTAKSHGTTDCWLVSFLSRKSPTCILTSHQRWGSMHQWRPLWHCLLALLPLLPQCLG